MMIRCAVVLAALLCVASTARLGAQQISAPAAPAVTNAAPASVDTTTTQAGPRLSPEWRRVESPMAQRNSAAAMSSDSHTVTVTTLVLVLVVIIVVLLVVK